MILKRFNCLVQQVGLNDSLSSSGTAPPTYAPDEDEMQNVSDWDFYMLVYGCSLLGIIVFGGMKSMITMKVRI